jgi:putative NADH-flavin reductase
VNIVVFGATGQTGRHVVDQALKRGHTVTAFARFPNRIHRKHERLHVVEGHVQDQVPVLKAIEGQDAVISVLGQVRERPTVAHVLTVAANNITEAMKFHDIRRIVFLLGAGVADSKDESSFASRLIVPLMRLLAGHVLKDAEDAAELIRASDLDWTIVRVPRLGDQPARGDPTSGYRKPGFSPLARADVATFMLTQLESDQHVHEAPIISYDGE